MTKIDSELLASADAIDNTQTHFIELIFLESFS